MKATLALLVLGCAALSLADDVKVDRGVLVLEKDTFQQVLSDNKHVLVEFCKSQGGRTRLGRLTPAGVQQVSPQQAVLCKA